MRGAKRPETHKSLVVWPRCHFVFAEVQVSPLKAEEKADFGFIFCKLLRKGGSWG